MQDDIISIALTREQLAHLRSALFRQLEEEAQALAEQAGEAGHVPNRVIGVDARGMYRTIIGDTAGLLDAIGWDTDGDAEQLVRKLEA